MPTADASQFTRLKKALVIQKTNSPIRADGKNVNRVSQYVTPLSGATVNSLKGNNNGFLPSVTLKFAQPRIDPPLNVAHPGRKLLFQRNCS